MNTAYNPTHQNDMDADESRSDLRGPAAVEKIRELVDKNKTCFFVTRSSAGYSDGARPMSVLEVDDEGHLWFMSARESHKNDTIAQDPRVTLYLQASEHSGFMRLDGRATIHDDRATIDRLWGPLLKVWFTEGKDDPRITCLRLQVDSGFYWDNRHGDMVAGIKMFIGALTGTTLDDSQVGQINP